MDGGSCLCYNRNTVAKIISGKNDLRERTTMVNKRYESDLTSKEKRELEREKLKSLHGKDKLDHIWTYYKTQIFLAVLAVALLYVAGKTIYRMQFDTVFYAIFVNAQTGDEEQMKTDFKSYLGDDDKYHEIVIDRGFYLTGNDSQDASYQVKLQALITGKHVDVMVADKDTFETYAEGDVFTPMVKLLSEEDMQRYKDDLEPNGIRIRNSKVLEKFGFEMGDEVYLGVFSYAPCPENAVEFIKYLEGEGKDE